jgi:formylglycine-generating enzyme required for sulfatase activity
VSSFHLDRFEVTVGRFRRFVEVYPGSKPQQGAGAHPAMRESSGWSPAWDDFLPATQAELIVQVSTFCDDNFGGQGYPTWSDEPAGADESLPMTCLSWFVAFAFCAWDGGRLPTEAEWNYAAAGGDEQRTYPWGEEAPDPSRAVFDCTADGSNAAECAVSDIPRAGSRSPDGDGRWGQADMAGSMFEWALDADAPYSDDPCVDCAVIDASTSRVVRGGAWFEVNPEDDVFLQANGRNRHGMSDVLPDLGVRCARDL